MRSAARLVVPAFLLAASRTAFAAFLPSDPFTNDARGTTAAPFLEEPVGARAEGLAGSYAAVFGDPDALYWNPAGLAGLTAPRLSASYDPLLETAYSSALSYAAPFHGGVLGLGAFYDSQSPLQGYDSFANPTGSINQYDLALEGGWAKTFDGTNVGAAVKVFQQSLAGSSAAGAAVDLGFQQQAAGFFDDGPVDVGVLVRNLGAPVRLGSVESPLPLEAAAGLDWHATDELSGLIDLHAPVDQAPYPSAGVEWKRRFNDMTAALRLGYSLGQSQQSLGNLAGLTLGGGLEILTLRLDYAWIPMGDLGVTQRFTFGYAFGPLPRTPPPSAVPNAAADKQTRCYVLSMEAPRLGDAQELGAYSREPLCYRLSGVPDVDAYLARAYAVVGDIRVATAMVGVIESRPKTLSNGLPLKEAAALVRGLLVGALDAAPALLDASAAVAGAPNGLPAVEFPGKARVIHEVKQAARDVADALDDGQADLKTIDRFLAR